MWIMAAVSAALLSGYGEAAVDAPAPQAELSCMTGPARKSFGGTTWLVYSCNDSRSMVVVADAGNPAAPFMFVVTNPHGRYVILGEGTGDKAASDAANTALSQLSDTQLADLLAETRK